jgi:alpha-tubulin suppressor-like RCC1 family protein
MAAPVVAACNLVLGLGDLSDRDEGSDATSALPADGAPTDALAKPGTDSGKDASGKDAALDATGPGSDAAIDAGPDAKADAGTPPGPARVAAGKDHICAIQADTSVKCTGKNDNNQLGHAGAPTTPSNVPLTVDGVTGVTQLAAYADTTCARLTGGTVKCWGDSNGHYPPESTSGVVEVAVAGFRSCVRYTNGNVGCWGNNNAGQLGGLQGGPVANVANATAMSAGDSAGYAIISGDLWAWGGNEQGQLGQGDGGMQSAAAVKVSVLSNVLQVSAGSGSACAIEQGVLYCWGYDSMGQLGTNLAEPRNFPRPVALTGVSFAEVAAGPIHTCARTTTGEVYCFGSNNLGRLGVNDTNLFNAVVPRKVPEFGPAGTAGPALEVRVGFGNSCARTATKIWCWGVGTEGQMGDGVYANRYAPVQTGL